MTFPLSLEVTSDQSPSYTGALLISKQINLHSKLVDVAYAHVASTLFLRGKAQGSHEKPNSKHHLLNEWILQEWFMAAGYRRSLFDSLWHFRAHGADWLMDMVAAHEKNNNTNSHLCNKLFSNGYGQRAIWIYDIWALICWSGVILRMTLNASGSSCSSH